MQRIMARYQLLGASHGVVNAAPLASHMIATLTAPPAMLAQGSAAPPCATAIDRPREGDFAGPVVAAVEWVAPSASERAFPGVPELWHSRPCEPGEALRDLLADYRARAEDRELRAKR
jgi:hypothetical protein